MNRLVDENLIGVVIYDIKSPIQSRECLAQCYIPLMTHEEDIDQYLVKISSRALLFNYVMLEDPLKKRPPRFGWIVDIESGGEDLIRKEGIGVRYDELKQYVKSPEKKIRQLFGVDSKAFIYLKIQILAEFDKTNSSLKELRTGTFMGDLVKYLPPEKALNYICRRSESNQIKVGVLYGTENSWVSLPLETIWRHIGVFGVTGSGKTNTLFVLCEQLSRNGVPVVAFAREPDFVNPDIVENFTEIYDAEKLKIPLWEIDIDVINYILGNDAMSEAMIDLYRRILDNLKYKLKKYNLEGPSLETVLTVLNRIMGTNNWVNYVSKCPEVKDGMVSGNNLQKIIQETMKPKGFKDETIRGLRRRIFKLKQILGRIISYRWGYDGQPFDPKQLVKTRNERGVIAILDLTGLDDLQRIAVVTILLSIVIRLRDEGFRMEMEINRLKKLLCSAEDKERIKLEIEKKEKYLIRETIHKPFVVAIDEIQTFAPDRERVPSIVPLRKIAQMGRKRGIGLLVATQYPTYIDAHIRRQLVTKIVHAIGIEAAKALDLHEILAKEILGSLPNQEVGVALLVTARDYLYVPIKIYIPLSKAMMR